MLFTGKESDHFVHDILFPKGVDRELVNLSKGEFSLFNDLHTRRVRIVGECEKGWDEEPLIVPLGVGTALSDIQSDSLSKAAQHVLCDELTIPHNAQWGAFSIPNREPRTGSRKSILKLSAPAEGYREALEYLTEGIRFGQTTSLDNPAGGMITYSNNRGRHLLNGKECTVDDACDVMEATLNKIQNSMPTTYKFLGNPDFKRVKIDPTTAYQLIYAISPNEKGLIDLFIKPSRGSSGGDSVFRVTINPFNHKVRIAANCKAALKLIFDPECLKVENGPYVQEFELCRAPGLVSHLINCIHDPIVERAIPGVALKNGQSVELRVMVVRAGHTECHRLSRSTSVAAAIGSYTKLSTSPVGNNIATGGQAAQVDEVLMRLLNENFPTLTELEKVCRIEEFMNYLYEYSERIGAALYGYHDSLADNLINPHCSASAFEAPFVNSVDFIPVLDRYEQTVTPIFLELGYFPKYEGLKQIAPSIAGLLDRYLDQWRS